MSDEILESELSEWGERGRLTGACVEVRVSPIHGKGVFATETIRDDSWIGRFEGDPTEEDGTYVLWLIDDEGVEVGIRGRNDLRFLNHGQPANAEFRDADLYATSDIERGAEVLIDYGEAWK